jgi:signal transduction histidine kinase
MEAQSKKSILVIDDEQHFLDLIYKTLREFNFEVFQAMNGEMGCKVAEKFLPDVIITDWDMPVLNGIQTIERLKENPQTSSIPVIMATGVMTSVTNLDMALKAGAFDYIRKPIDSIELVARINSALKLSGSYQEIKHQAEKLEELNASKDKFFSIIAHDLRNPFHGILFSSQHLMEILKNSDNSESLTFVTLIHDVAKNAHELLENLLEWSRSQTGNIEFKPRKFAVKELVDDVMRLYENSFITKHITATVSISDDLNILADYNMLNTILRNLISNAIKYTHIDGHIDITVEPKDQEIEFIVSDDGVGLSTDNQMKLFKLTEKVSTLGTANEKGSGLGLLLCKDFVEMHQGRIWIESEEGKGCKVKFTISKL